LGDFPLATLLVWALFGDEGIEDLIEDIPLKVKGRRELLNLECSINYDAKGASSRRGEGKARLIAFDGFGHCCLVGVGVVGFFGQVGLWVFLLFLVFWACGGSLCI
jgi:hypothetical protein